MPKHFISEPIHPAGNATSLPANNEPALPAAFTWRDETLEVKALRTTWRTTKTDRGDVYLKRHWFEFETADGRIATVYYDRAAKRGSPSWSLYALEDAAFRPLAERIREIVSSDASREDRARSIADEIRKIGPYRWAGIYEVTAAEVRNIAFSGPGAPAYPAFSRDKGLTGEMLRRKETVISGDVSNDPNYLTAFSSTRSEMIVPVRSRSGEIIGTIDIESESDNAFGDEDRAVAEAVATIIEPLFWR